MPATPTDRDPDRRATVEQDDTLDDLPEDDAPEHELIEEFERSQRREAGLSEDAPPGHGPDKDDADLEDLIHEDGARSPYEEGGEQPADHEQSVVEEDDNDFGLEEDERPTRRPPPGAER